MKLIENIGAVDCVYKCINSDDNDLKWDEVSKLMRAITDKHMESSFDFVVNNEFPNGVDYWEFIKFVREEQDFIYSELGIDNKE